MCGGPGGKWVEEGRASWHCDTEAVWRTGREMSAAEIADFIENHVPLDSEVSVVWTGGEPVSQDIEICTAIKTLSLHQFPSCSLFHELETNGTIDLSDQLHYSIDQINCSPKLSNSGIEFKHRIHFPVLRRIMSHPNAWLKFVVDPVKDDLPSMLREIDGIRIDSHADRDRVILMPAVECLAELPDKTRRVFEICKDYGYRASTRLQVLAWDKTTGV